MKMKKLSPMAFSLTAPFYDLIYQHRNIGREVRFITKHIRNHFPNTQKPSLLDVGSGTGAHAILFGKQGFDVTGVDRSAEMIAIANHKALSQKSKVRFIRKDFLTYTSASTYHVVTSLFDVVSYMTTNKDVRDFFTNASSLLHKNSLFVFDCWYGPGVLLSQPKTMRQRYRGENFTVYRKKTPTVSYQTNTVSVLHQLTVRGSTHDHHAIEETHVMRYFFYPELEDYLRQAGLRIVEWGTIGFPLQTPKTPPWSIYIIAQKIR